MVSILSAILDQTGPRQFGLNGVPHVTKSLFWHVRVANNAVGLAQELGARVAANFNERRVAVSYSPFQVRH